ncbi:hypothetical protein PHMEG_00011596 [Phytophthora megakarya]|uniref:Uncharacterized protein n=1 Tax=Phytophthora megakarya TaxID=4795 RepID=A0A225WCJ3_9STRA|nr:hypothetical protein PHMEG_00011596 [Phytophthora megakarya]
MKVDPFRSMIIEGMSINVPLSTSNLIKSREYVFVEETDILNFTNGEHIDHHFLQSAGLPESLSAASHNWVGTPINSFSQEAAQKMTFGSKLSAMPWKASLVDFVVYLSAIHAKIFSYSDLLRGVVNIDPTKIDC